MSLVSNSLLRDRSLLLKKVRSFFEEKNILEVDCPALNPFPALDRGIDAVEASISTNEIHYLHTSPEYAMKKLLSKGSGDIYYLGHVFRKGEKGSFHSPEFTMIEYYRVNMAYEKFIEETLCLLSLFLDDLPYSYLTYHDAFTTYLGIDPDKASTQELLFLAKKKEPSFEEKDREVLLDFLLVEEIEPHLGKGEFLVLHEYPKKQAALAQTFVRNGREVARRFEIYHQGVELTNGYHELSDPIEQKKRFLETNKERKTPYPLDESFLLSLENLPDCCGVSVGFDRLMMLRHKLTNIKQTFASIE